MCFLQSVGNIKSDNILGEIIHIILKTWWKSSWRRQGSQGDEGDGLVSVEVLLGSHLTVDEPGVQSIAKRTIINGGSQPGSPDNLVADVAGPAVDGSTRAVLAHHRDDHLEMRRCKHSRYIPKSTKDQRTIIFTSIMPSASC